MLDISATGKLVLAVAVPTTMVFVYWLLKKNEDEEEEDSMSQIATSRQTVIEVKVPKEAVGAVIGRQGITIKQLQQDSGARIKFKDRDTSARDSDEDRTVVIHGSPDNAQAAEIMVREIIANMPVIRSEEVYVPVKCLGRLIGRNGDSIRQMCRTSKAKIKIDPKGDERDPNSLKLILITGGDQQIELAKSLIEEKVQEEEAFRARTAVQAANREHRNTRRRDATQTPSAPITHSPMSVPVGAESWDVRVTEESEWADHQDSYMEVYMSAVENPGHFWVQIISSKAAQLDQLITEMSIYYSQLPPEDPSVTTFNVGDVIATPFPHDSSWYRARILGFEGDKVDLYYVDFGDNALLNVDQIRTLRGDFLSLPFQAIECYLANIKPREAGWTEQASVDFEEMTYCAQWKVIMAKTIRYKPSERGLIPCLHIIDTTGDQDIDVNAELVRRGYADWDPEPPRASAGGLGDLTQVSIGYQVTAAQRECMALHGYSPLSSSVGNQNCSAQNDNSSAESKNHSTENENHSAENKDTPAGIEPSSARNDSILTEDEQMPENEKIT